MSRWLTAGLLLAVACGSRTALPPGDAGGGSGGAAGSGGGVDAGTGGADAGPVGGSGGAPDAAGPDAPIDAGSSCDCGAFAAYRACCGSRCVNLQNDPTNCGACGNHCQGDKPLCQAGVCQAPPCMQTGCAAGQCCGGACCQAGQLCCDFEGPIGGIVGCFTPTADQPTCPAGCAPLCISDRALKRSIEPVNPQQVLEQAARSSSAPADPVDAHGQALAALQALQGKAIQQRLHIERLERQHRALERRLRALERRGGRR